jgi:aspartyl protease
MRINGRWRLWSDGTVLPMIRLEVLAQDGGWRQDDFLVDTGADGTAFTVDLQAHLGLPSTPAASVTGVGGAAPSVLIATSLRLQRDDGGTVTVHSRQFVGLSGPSAFDMNVLGRDILDLFAVIVDRPGNVVCLLAPRHQYAVVVV